MRSIAREFKPSIFEKEVDFALLLRESWELKKLSNPLVSNPKVDKAIQTGFSIGATAAKLLGAGESGFILFFVPHRARAGFMSDSLRLNWSLIKVRPDLEGVITIYSDEVKSNLEFWGLL